MESREENRLTRRIRERKKNRKKKKKNRKKKRKTILKLQLLRKLWTGHKSQVLGLTTRLNSAS